MKELLGILLVGLIFSLIAFNIPIRKAFSASVRNCQVSVFPVHIEPGNQCHFGDVAVGFDHVENKIACGRIQVSCD